MISILLATYNSGDRLPFLLTSLQNQTYRDWSLYIHDDGSSDNTLEVCKDFARQDDRIIIVEDSMKHRGSKGSFMWLLSQVQSDYYMFCDQDDVWLPFKIELTLDYMKRQECASPDCPILVHTDLAVCDGQYTVTHHSLWKQSRVHPEKLLSLDYMGLFPFVTGCTMMINQYAKNVSLPMKDGAPMHDWWIAHQVLKYGGEVINVHKSTILYCQHGGNVVGANKISFAYFRNKLKNFRIVINANKVIYSFLKEIDGMTLFNYWICKVLYSIYRIIK